MLIRKTTLFVLEFIIQETEATAPVKVAVAVFNQRFREETCIKRTVTYIDDCKDFKDEEIDWTNGQGRIGEQVIEGGMSAAAAEPPRPCVLPFFKVIDDADLVTNLMQVIQMTTDEYLNKMVFLATIDGTRMLNVQLTIDNNPADLVTELNGPLQPNINDITIDGSDFFQVTFEGHRTFCVVDTLENYGDAAYVSALIEHEYICSVPDAPTHLYIFGLNLIQPPVYFDRGELRVRYDYRVTGTQDADCCGPSGSGEGCCDEEIFSTIAPTLMSDADDLGSQIASALTVDSIRTNSGKTGKNAALKNVIAKNLINAMANKAKVGRNGPSTPAVDDSIDI